MSEIQKSESTSEPARPIKVLDPTKPIKPGRERWGSLTGNERKARGLWVSDEEFKKRREAKKQRLVTKKRWWEEHKGEQVRLLRDAIEGDFTLSFEQRSILQGMIGMYVRENRPYSAAKILRDLGDHYQLWTQHHTVEANYVPNKELQSLLTSVYVRSTDKTPLQ